MKVHYLYIFLTFLGLIGSSGGPIDTSALSKRTPGFSQARKVEMDRRSISHTLAFGQSVHVSAFGTYVPMPAKLSGGEFCRHLAAEGSARTLVPLKKANSS